MRTTVVPAQITTVEDRVAGNFTFIQIVLLVIPMVIGAIIYASFAPKLRINPLKISLIATEAMIFGILAIRWGGKIIADWLIIYLRYSARPRRYIFTKNDLIHRDIVIEKEETVVITKSQDKEKVPNRSKLLSLKEQIKIDQLLGDEAMSISFKFSEKGGVDVSLKQIEG